MRHQNNINNDYYYSHLAVRKNCVICIYSLDYFFFFALQIKIEKNKKKEKN